ncbi:MAG: hypothetical protein K0R65_2637 [Crocinitomicaceae bacterium]|jgi:hypothetical protein|nr:hypothetical protein [Crocinitomicaceae bacterium]
MNMLNYKNQNTMKELFDFLLYVVLNNILPFIVISMTALYFVFFS